MCSVHLFVYVCLLFFSLPCMVNKDEYKFSNIRMSNKNVDDSDGIATCEPTHSLNRLAW